MKEDICITIIVPIYKVEKYINRCLNSIINQTYSNLDIILVDDGSPDNCPKICDEYEKKDNRIKVIHKENGGLSDARNVGLKYAKGDYVWYIDSDDEIIGTAVQELVDIILKYKADIICFSFKEMIEETHKEFINNFFKTTSSKQIEELSYNEAISKNINRVGIRYEATSRIYSIEVAKQVEFPKNKLAEDFATFYLFLKKAKKIIFYDNQIYIYYRRLNSIMGCKNEKLYMDIYNNEIAYYNEIKQLELSNKDKKKAEDNYFRTLIKTYAKLYDTKNEKIVKEIECKINDINMNSLEKKSKILLMCFKINHRLTVIIIRKLYKKL